MSFHYRVPKRFTDLNAGGHVDHGVVIDYLQESRTEFLLSAPGPVSGMLDSGVLVTGHQLEYLAPIGYHQPAVDAEVWVDQVGGARFSISYRLSEGGESVVRARTFLTPYDLTAGALRRLTDAERDQLAAAVEEPVDIQPLGRVKPDDLSHAHLQDCRVRWADLDSYRHVNNVKFADYLSQARLELLSAAGPLTTAEPWVVVRLDIDYKAPIDFRREPYRVRTAIAHLGTTSVEVAADIVDPLATEPKPYATARAVLVQLGSDGQPKPIAAGIADVLGA